MTRIRVLAVLFAVMVLCCPRAYAQKPPVDTPRISQVVRIYDLTLTYPPPLWIGPRDDVMSASERYREEHDNSFLLEEIPKAETFRTWKQMLKVTGAYTHEAEKIGLDGAVERSVGGYLRACEDNAFGLEMLGHDAHSIIFVIACGNTPNGPAEVGYGEGIGEVAVARLFIVANTIAQVQYSWRGPKFAITDHDAYPVPLATLMHAASLLETEASAAPR